MEKRNLILSTSLKNAYDEQYINQSREWRELGAKYKAKNILDLCANLNIWNNGKVLEVGAGDGSILMYLNRAKFGEELYALEISKSGVEAIKNRNLKSVKSIQQFDGYNIPFSNNAFDIVILSHVIEHVEFPRLLLREIKRVSRYQILEVPCDFSFGVDKKVEYFLSYGHINIFIPSLFRFLLRSEGFKIISDKISFMTKDVAEHMVFINQRKKKSILSKLTLNLSILIRKIIFVLLPKRIKELNGNAYTVLCEKNGHDLEIF